MDDTLKTYRAEVKQELENILLYWMNHAIDEEHGGFYGRIDNANNKDAKAQKGAVLNSRILWTFSAAYNATGEAKHVAMADRAFDYIVNHFLDKQFGGVYWSVDYKGRPLNDKKQMYALSFAVYALSEYHSCTQNKDALHQAVQLFEAITKYGYDKKQGGYIEALTRDWKNLADVRLSEKDRNEKKSMNTHLHVLEAFANLYKVWPNEALKDKIEELIDIFLGHIIHANTHHLILFFDESWAAKSNIISFGHDIEAAWLIQEAAEVIKNEALLARVKRTSLQIAAAAAEGLDLDGGLWYEKEAGKHQAVKEKHWWVQAESMIGFFNAWQLTSNENFLIKSINSWKFIKEHLIDKVHGEWFWGVKEDHSIMESEDKVGLWKCCYHNSRACLEIMKRIT